MAPKHAPLLRPFVLAALACSLAGASLGVVLLLRLHLALGPVAVSSTQLHGQTQVFGFLALFVIGFASFLVPRIAGGKPLTRAGALWSAFALLLAAALATLAYALGAPERLARAVAGLATGAGTVVAAFALHGPVAEQRKTEATVRGYERLLEAALAFLALAGLADAAAWLAPAPGDAAAAVGFAQAAWRLGVDGFAVGMALAVSARMFPGFLGIPPRLAYPSAGSARKSEPGAAIAFGLAGSAWAAGTLLAALAELVPGTLVRALAEPLLAAGIVALSLRLGLASTKGGARIDRSQDPWFAVGARSAYALLVAGALTGAAAGVAEALGADVAGAWWDARRHLVTLGFVMTLIATMAGRLAPGYAGRKLALPWLRALAIVCFPLAALMRAVEAVAGQWGPAWLLDVSAASSAPASLGFLALVASVAATLLARER